VNAAVGKGSRYGWRLHRMISFSLLLPSLARPCQVIYLNSLIARHHLMTQPVVSSIKQSGGSKQASVFAFRYVCVTEISPDDRGLSPPLIWVVLIWVVCVRCVCERLLTPAAYRCFSFFVIRLEDPVEVAGGREDENFSQTQNAMSGAILLCCRIRL